MTDRKRRFCLGLLLTVLAIASLLLAVSPIFSMPWDWMSTLMIVVLGLVVVTGGGLVVSQVPLARATDEGRIGDLASPSALQRRAATEAPPTARDARSSRATGRRVC